MSRGWTVDDFCATDCDRERVTGCSFSQTESLLVLSAGEYLTVK